MKYQAALFDLDGTLLDTLDDLADSMNSALATVGLPPHPVDAYKHFVGDGVHTLAMRVLPEDRRDHQTVECVVAAMRDAYSKNWSCKTKIYPCVEKMLSSLKERGVAMGVLSNKPDDFTKLMVRHYFPDSLFAAVSGQQSGGSKKPDPAGALRIAAQFRISPENFAYLGDTNTDMQTAVAAGMFPVGAAWGFRTAEELEAYGARLIIYSAEEFLTLF